MRLSLIAPAKINWTLEVLGRRSDGYHEVRTVLQTVDLWDEVEMEPFEEMRIRMPGAEESETGISAESNLAMRAAMALRWCCGRGYRSRGGWGVGAATRPRCCGA